MTGHLAHTTLRPRSIALFRFVAARNSGEIALNPELLLALTTLHLNISSFHGRSILLFVLYSFCASCLLLRKFASGPRSQTRRS